MAKIEHDREDLMREGVNMPVRGRFRSPGEKHSEWVIGWRKDGGVRVFDGADPVFQFDHQNRLRRVYFQRRKLAVRDRQLVEMHRDSDAGNQVAHRLEPLSPNEQSLVMETWARLHRKLSELAECGDLESVGDSPKDFRLRLNTWLNAVGCEPKLASSS